MIRPYSVDYGFMRTYGQGHFVANLGGNLDFVLFERHAFNKPYPSPRTFWNAIGIVLGATLERRSSLPKALYTPNLRMPVVSSMLSSGYYLKDKEFQRIYFANVPTAFPENQRWRYTPILAMPRNVERGGAFEPFYQDYVTVNCVTSKKQLAAFELWYNRLVDAFTFARAVGDIGDGITPLTPTFMRQSIKASYEGRATPQEALLALFASGLVPSLPAANTCNVGTFFEAADFLVYTNE